MPSIDDGAKSKEESLTMLSDSLRQGVTLCVATPHCVLHKEEDLQSFLVKRESSFKQIENDIKKEGFPRVLLGAEVLIDNDISRFENIELLCIEGSRALLIELGAKGLSKEMSEWIYSLTMKKITPIIAHIERYPDSLKITRELADMSVYYQINASSVLSLTKRRLIKKLLATGKNFLLSSDMHNITSRPSLMKRASRFAKNKNFILYEKGR